MFSAWKIIYAIEFFIKSYDNVRNIIDSCGRENDVVEIEAADIVLMDDDPRQIAQAISISKKTLRIVYENIYFAIGVKLTCLVLGALGLAGMWAAIFADVGVMVLAVLNALRTLHVKKLFPSRGSEAGLPAR